MVGAASSLRDRVSPMSIQVGVRKIPGHRLPMRVGCTTLHPVAKQRRGGGGRNGGGGSGAFAIDGRVCSGRDGLAQAKKEKEAGPPGRVLD